MHDHLLPDGVLPRLDTGTVTLAAADGFRLALRTVMLTDTLHAGRLECPGTYLVEVAHSRPSAPDRPITLRGAAGEYQLHVGQGDVEITSRLIDGHFPDYKPIITHESTTTTIILGTVDHCAPGGLPGSLHETTRTSYGECAPPPPCALGLLASHEYGCWQAMNRRPDVLIVNASGQIICGMHFTSLATPEHPSAARAAIRPDEPR